MTQRTIKNPVNVELATIIHGAVIKAMQVRKDNFATNATPYALAHRMAGELGQALFGLNTWGDDELADQCREVHRIAMNFLETDIKYAQNFGQERGAA